MREPLEEHYNTDKPVEEGREKPPGQEDVQKSTKPPDPEGSQNSDNGEYRGNGPLRPDRNEQQEKEEKDKKKRETRRGPVRERGRKLSRPPREEVLDKDNTFCRPCRIDFGGRVPFLEHYLLVHQRKLWTKNGGSIPSSSPQGGSPSRPLTPEPEVNDRSRGPQLGRPEPAAPGQLRGQPATQGWNSGPPKAVSPGPVSLSGQKTPRHAQRATSKRKYPGKPNPQVAGGTPEIVPWRTDGKKGKSGFWTKETEGQEGPNQDVSAREKRRTRLAKRLKEGETWRGRVGSDQKRARRETRGRQGGGPARGGSTKGQVTTRTRRGPQRKRRRPG